MPVGHSEAIFLKRGTVGELYRALEVILAAEGNADAPVVTEVGLNTGQSTFIGSKVISLRVELGGRVVISGDERDRHELPLFPPNRRIWEGDAK